LIQHRRQLQLHVTARSVQSGSKQPAIIVSRSPRMQETPKNLSGFPLQSLRFAMFQWDFQGGFFKFYGKIS